MSSSAGEVQYLTVQDILWINLQVTGEVNTYEFMKLEEGTNYQYGYGGSHDVPAQAKSLLTGLIKNEPFSAGNDETAQVAYRAFLGLNGFIVDDAGAIQADGHAGHDSAQAIIQRVIGSMKKPVG